MGCFGVLSTLFVPVNIIFASITYGQKAFILLCVIKITKAFERNKNSKGKFSQKHVVRKIISILKTKKHNEEIIWVITM